MVQQVVGFQREFPHVNTIILQIITGIFLGLHYTSDLKSAYSSLFFFIREIFYGWCLRYLHSSGAWFVFLFLFLHLGRAIISFLLTVWPMDLRLKIIATASRLVDRPQEIEELTLPWAHWLWGIHLIILEHKSKLQRRGAPGWNSGSNVRL